jgi:hypothetical protein
MKDIALRRSSFFTPLTRIMNTLARTILAALGIALLSPPLSNAQNWGYGGNYSQTISGVTPQGKSYNSTVTSTYNQNYGAGGWMGTGCPNGLGWALFGINAVRGMAQGAPVPIPTSASAPYGGGYGYGGGEGYYNGGCHGGYYVPTCPTYRAGWGVAPY